jgi:hypothetical protein
MSAQIERVAADYRAGALYASPWNAAALHFLALLSTLCLFVVG